MCMCMRMRTCACTCTCTCTSARTPLTPTNPVTRNGAPALAHAHTRAHLQGHRAMATAGGCVRAHGWTHSCLYASRARASMLRIVYTFMHVRLQVQMHMICMYWGAHVGVTHVRRNSQLQSKRLQADDCKATAIAQPNLGDYSIGRTCRLV
jgi:hypothetical protein